MRNFVFVVRFLICSYVRVHVRGTGHYKLLSMLDGIHIDWSDGLVPYPSTYVIEVSPDGHRVYLD